MIKTPYDYAGFVGDGIADDTLALQAALNDPSCSWLDFTDVVGARHTDTLTLSRPKLITGIKGRSRLKYVQSAGAARPALSFIAGSEGSEVRGVMSDYNLAPGITTTQGGVSGVFLLNADNITLSDIAVDGHKSMTSPLVRVSGVSMDKSGHRIRGARLVNLTGYGVNGGVGAGGLQSDIILDDVFVQNIGDGYGIAFTNGGGALSRIKLLRCHVDMSAEPASSIKNAIFVGAMNASNWTKDVIVDGCSIACTPLPDNTVNGSITLGNVAGGRVVNSRVTGGGIGISIAFGYDTVVVGNTVDMSGAYNAAQGRIGYGIELAGSEIVCVGNAIEGHATLAQGIAVQSGQQSIYNVNIGPNNIQAVGTRIFVQAGHPGPIRTLDP